jgi:hypothetical protein
MGRTRGGGISDGLLFAGSYGLGGSSGVICLPGETSIACAMKRTAAVLQSILMFAILIALGAWAYFHRRQIYRAIRY